MVISFDDFKKVELTAGKILSAKKVPETDKLLKLSVDFGVQASHANGEPVPEDSALQNVSETPDARDVRQIVSGIAGYFPDPEMLVGKTYMFVTNIAPRIIKGLASNGMILALTADDGAFSLLELNENIPSGTRAR